MSHPRNIDHLLEEIVSLPSLPGIVTRVIDLLDSPSSSLEEVSHLMSTDAGLALKTLRLANSAYYGLREKVTSVEQAVVYLGERVIKNLVFAATVFDTLKKGTGAILRHSISCGLAMEILVGCRERDLPLRSDEAFVYGLLHDVGKVIFEEFLPKEHQQVLRLIRKRRMSACEAELEVLGVDHSEMGARLVQRWQLADELVSAVAGHHDVSRCQEPAARSLAALLGVADYICFASGIVVEPKAVVSLPEESWEYADLATQEVPGVLGQFFEAIPAVDELVAIAV